MLQGYFKEIQNPNLSEEQIIQRLKNKGKLTGKKTVKEDTTPLIEAVKRNLYQVVKFLIEEKGADINEKVVFARIVQNDSGKKSLDKATFTAIEVAILHKQENIAEYLLTQIKNKEGSTYRFCTKNDGYCIALQFAVMHDFLDVFKLILSIQPELLNHKSTENQNLLMLAVKHRAYNIVEYLLQPAENSMPRNDLNELDDNLKSAYFVALGIQDSRLIKLMLQYGASPLILHPSSFDTPLDQILKCQKPNIQIINLLLACGAGLDKSRIPPEIFSIFKMRPQALGPMLLTVTCNGKYSLIDTPQKMQQCLNNSTYVFEMDFLTTTLKDSHLNNLEHIQSIRNLPPFSSHVYESVSLIEHPEPICLSYKDILKFDEKTLSLQITSNLHEFAVYGEILNTEIQKYENNIDHSLEKSISDYFDEIQTLLSMLTHPKAITVNFEQIISKLFPQTKETDIYSLLRKNLNEVIQKFVGFIDTKKDHEAYLILLHSKFMDTASIILSPEEAENLALSPNEVEKFSNLILDNIIHLGNQLASSFLQNAQFDEAIHYAKKSLKKNDFDYDKKSCEFAKNDIIQKIYSLFILATANLGQGNRHQAEKYFHKALEQTYFELNEHMTTILSQLIPLLTKEYSLKNTLLFNELIHFISSDALDNKSTIEALLLPYRETLNQFVKLYLRDITPSLMEMLKDLGKIMAQEADNTLICKINAPIVQDPSLKRFLKRNQDINCSFAENKILLTTNFILSTNFKTRFLQLMQILKLPVQLDTSCSMSDAMPSITQQLTDLRIQDENKIKAKTRGTPNPAKQKRTVLQQNRIVPNYDFVQLPCYTKPIPIQFKDNSIPEDTLFITMPLTDEYAPFFGLFKDKDANCYHPIKGIDPKGKNQQGAKVKSNLVRLKILGCDGQGQLRAWGQVEQEIKLPDNRIKKLFVINEVVTKKVENRK